MNILHITDLHCGLEETSVPIGDTKDESLTEKFTGQLRYEDCRELFLSRVLDLLQGNPVDIIACTGDLGVLKIGAEYIAKLAGKLVVKPDGVIISPGNHDLDRDARDGNELNEFLDSCADNGFRCAGWETPLCTTVKGVPIVAFNSCLGGTQHTRFGVPEKYWIKARRLLEQMGRLRKDKAFEAMPDLRVKLQALDIPAVGKSQLESASDYLRQTRKKFVIALIHHNPLPTSGVEVRPYATLVDSGRLLSRLVENGRRALVLHGHAHCDSTFQVQIPDSSDDDPGCFTTIGDHGLHGMSDYASATHIQVLVDKDDNFLAGVVSRFVNRGYDFKRESSFYFFDIPSPIRQETPALSTLDVHKKYSFREIADTLGLPPDDNLATTLLRLTTVKPISIGGIGLAKEAWEITRNA